MGIAWVLLGLLPLALLPDFAAHAGDADDPADDGGAVGGDAPERDADDGPPSEGDLVHDDANTGGNDDDNTQSDGVLLPLDETDLPDDGTDPVEPGSVLQPVNEDDAGPDTGDDLPDALLPVDQIDPQNQVVEVDFEDDGGIAYTEIEHFETGQDTLVISIEPGSITGPLDLSVTPAPGGHDSLVYLEGRLVAVLKDAPDAGVQDVSVVVG